MEKRSYGKLLTETMEKNIQMKPAKQNNLLQ